MDQKYQGHQQGVIFVLVAMMILIFVTMVAIIINVSYSNIVRSELQIAADAAAHAGAAQLCSTQTCWEHARQAAVKTLGQHVVHGRMADKARFSPNLFDAGGSPLGPKWVEGNFEVLVQRGRWWPKAVPAGFGIRTYPARGSFEPYDVEAESWQALHPGCPDYSAANAVRVKIKRPQMNMFISPYGRRDYSVEAEAIAHADLLRRECVPPFAIPVCHLVNADGDYDPARACEFDRYFTQSARYCGPGVDCSVLPGFPWQPTDEPDPWVIADPKWCVEYDPAAPNPDKCYDPNLSCAFRQETPANVSVSDHYGVVGLPVPLGDPMPEDPEQLISYTLDPANEQPCFWTETGDQFRILEGGLTNEGTGDQIWRQIISGMDPPGARFVHTPYKDTELSHFQVNHRLSNNRPWCLRGDYPPPADSSWGMCNSRYFSFNPADCVDPTVLNCELGTNFLNEVWFGPMFLILIFRDYYTTPCFTDNSLETRSVWQIRVPVIADYAADGAPCEGRDGAASDPLIDPNRTYIVIGFTTVNIFDVDIGVDPPADPAPGDPYYACTQAYPVNLLGDLRKIPWGFSRGRCNLVRARSVCDSNFFPSDTDRAPRRKPMIVY